jgi:ABC-type uncharacterized transport system permease subunit
MEEFSKIESSELSKFLEKYEVNRIRSSVTENIITIVIASLGLIAALSWDEFLKHLFENLFGGEGSLNEQFLYALVITIVAASISVCISKFYKRSKK